MANAASGRTPVQRGATVMDRARVAYHVARFIRRELASDSPFPLTSRLRAIRRGFYSDKLALYDSRRLGDGVYLSDLQFILGTGRLNGEYRHLLNDKLAFHWLMSVAPHARPTMFGYVDSGSVRFLDAGAREKLAEHVAAGDSVVIKPIRGGGGHGVQIWTPPPNTSDAMGQLLVHASTFERNILIEYIEQAAYARTIFPDAANTVRILTLWDHQTAEPFVAAAAHRFGADRSAPTDNFSAGGLTADVDLATGILGYAAIRADYSQTRRPGLRWVDHHPETGSPIAGVGIPHWEHVLSEVLEIHRRLPYMRSLGWDIAVTDDGFRILEANNTPSPSILQIHRPLLAEPRTRLFYHHSRVVPAEPERL